VISARASLAERRLYVEGSPDPSLVIAAVERAGYKATAAATA
jgi:hypothetical protein